MECARDTEVVFHLIKPFFVVVCFENYNSILNVLTIIVRCTRATDKWIDVDC